MMKKLLGFLILAGLAIPTFGQIKSPEEFLGYPLGSRFTPHHKIISYFQHLQEKSPGKMKYITYGETYEGRPLSVAFLSSEENILSMCNIYTNIITVADIRNSSTLT